IGSSLSGKGDSARRDRVRVNSSSSGATDKLARRAGDLVSCAVAREQGKRVATETSNPRTWNRDRAARLMTIGTASTTNFRLREHGEAVVIRALLGPESELNFKIFSPCRSRNISAHKFPHKSVDVAGRRPQRASI